MGIRFACHVCQRRLNIKRELAGRRGICPVCAARIRIPLVDSEKSTPVDEKPQDGVSAPSRIGTGSDDPPRQPRDEHLASDRSSADATEDPPAGADSEAIDMLAEQPEATWYVRPPSGGQYGPATTELLRQWIEEGRVAATALLWREGWPQWRDAREALPEFSQRLPESGPISTDAATIAASPDVPDAANSPTSATSGLAGGSVPSRSRWSRNLMTACLLSVLALSLILVLAFAVTR